MDRRPTDDSDWVLTFDPEVADAVAPSLRLPPTWVAPKAPGCACGGSCCRGDLDKGGEVDFPVIVSQCESDATCGGGKRREPPPDREGVKGKKSRGDLLVDNDNIPEEEGDPPPEDGEEEGANEGEGEGESQTDVLIEVFLPPLDGSLPTIPYWLDIWDDGHDNSGADLPEGPKGGGGAQQDEEAQQDEDQVGPDCGEKRDECEKLAKGPCDCSKDCVCVPLLIVEDEEDEEPLHGGVLVVPWWVVLESGGLWALPIILRPDNTVSPDVDREAEGLDPDPDLDSDDNSQVRCTARCAGVRWLGSFAPCSDRPGAYIGVGYGQSLEEACRNAGVAASTLARNDGCAGAQCSFAVL